MQEELPCVYKDLRNRIRIHIKQIRKTPKKHPEYTIALLIAVASEALGRLRGKNDYVVFAKELLGKKYGVSEEVGRGLFEAVRHGLAHRYDTALIQVGKQHIVVVITWKKPDYHLRIRTGEWLGDGIQRLGIYLDMDTMWQDLDALLRKMTRQLHQEMKLARLVTKRGRWLDQKYTVRPDKERSAAWLTQWQAFLNTRA